MPVTQGAPIVIQPGGVGEVLDAGIRLARRHYWPLVLLSAWGFIPWFFINAIVAVTGGVTNVSFGGGLGRQTVAITNGPTPSLIVLNVLTGLVGFIIVSLALLAVLIACGRLITDERSPGGLATGTLYRLAWGRFGAYVVLAIVCLLLAVPLTILFPLGIFLFVRWSVSLAVLVLEQKGPFASLRRSWRLTAGSWWHVFGTLLVWWILLFVLEIVLLGIAGAIASVLILSGKAVFGTIVSAAADLILLILITPISMAIYAVLYYELRARREGFDLTLRAQQMSST